MAKPLETDRMILRPLHESDYGLMRAMHLDPEIMKYIGAGAQRTEEQTRQAIEKYLQAEREHPALGLWVLVLKDSKKEIGNILLRKPATAEETEGLEIGFSLFPEYWGKGFVPEASEKLIEYAIKEFGTAVRIIALIDPSNQSSRRVLDKLGFQTAGTVHYVDVLTGRKIPSELLELLPGVQKESPKDNS